MYSPEDNALIASYRAKAAADTLTKEEQAHAVKLLRQARMSAVQTSAKKRTASKVPVDTDQLLNELENI